MPEKKTPKVAVLRGKVRHVTGGKPRLFRKATESKGRIKVYRASPAPLAAFAVVNSHGIVAASHPKVGTFLLVSPSLAGAEHLRSGALESYGFVREKECGELEIAPVTVKAS